MDIISVITIIVLFYGTIIGFFAGVIGCRGDSAEYTYNLGNLDDLSILFKYANHFIIPCVLFASPVGFIGILILYFLICMIFYAFNIGIDISINSTIFETIVGTYILLYLIALMIGYCIGYFVTSKVIDNLIKKYSHEEE